MLFLCRFFARQTFNLGSRNWAKESLEENPAEFSVGLVQLTFPCVYSTLAHSLHSCTQATFLSICAARTAAKPAKAWRIRQKQLRMIQSKNRLQLVDQSEASVHGLASLSVWQRLTQLQNLLDSHCEKTVNFRKSFSHKSSLWNSKLLDTRYVFYFLNVLNSIIYLKFNMELWADAKFFAHLRRRPSTPFWNFLAN